MGTARIISLVHVELKQQHLVFGGYLSRTFNVTGATEEYDGTTWTPGGNIGTARNNV
jgi:hypothetical protein